MMKESFSIVETKTNVVIWQFIINFQELTKYFLVDLSEFAKNYPFLFVVF